jgi:hypothetical protein
MRRYKGEHNIKVKLTDMDIGSTQSTFSPMVDIYTHGNNPSVPVQATVS